MPHPTSDSVTDDPVRREFVRLSRIAIVVSLVYLGIAVALYLLRADGRTFRPTVIWVLVQHLVDPQGDSWDAMKLAFDTYDSGKVASLYDLIRGGQTKFQYPPTSLLLYAGAKSLGISLTARMLGSVSWLCIALTVVVSAWLWLPLARRLAGGDAGRGLSRDAILRWATATAIAGVLYYPLFKAYSLGQVQAWLDALFALALAAWLCEKRLLAGILIGLICLFKPQLSLFAVWALLRGQWGFVRGWAVCFGLGLGLALLRFGLENHIDYVRLLSEIARVGEGYFPNQSINGLLNRALHNGNNVEWDVTRFAPYNPIVHAMTFLSSAGLIAFAVLWRRRKGADLLDFASAGLVFTIASPIAWEHHYGIVLPIAVVLLFSILTSPHSALGRSRALLAWLVCYGLCATFLPITNRLADTPANVLQSTLLFGALGFLGLLSWQRHGSGAPVARAPERKAS